MKIGKDMLLGAKFYLVIGILTTIFITIKDGIFLLLLALVTIVLWVGYILIDLKKKSAKIKEEKK